MDQTPDARSWTFLSNHAQALISIADNPDVRIRDIAGRIGITERATQSIVNDLVEAGYVSRRRIGRRNSYTVDTRQPLRHRALAHNSVGSLLSSLVPWKDDGPEPDITPAPANPPIAEALPRGLADETRGALDKLATLARTLLDVPICLVSMMGEAGDLVVGADQPCAVLTAEILRLSEAGGGPLVVCDLDDDADLRAATASRPDVRSLAVVPLLTNGGGLIGLLCVADRRPRAWSEMDVRLLTSLAAAAAAQVEVAIVSDRHQAAALRYRALLDSMPEAVILVFDQDLRYQVASGQALSRSGYDPAALIGRRLEETVTPQQAERLLPHYRAGLRGHRHEFEQTTASGVVFRVEIVPVPDRDGAIRAVMAVAREVDAAQAA